MLSGQIEYFQILNRPNTSSSGDPLSKVLSHRGCCVDSHGDATQRHRLRFRMRCVNGAVRCRAVPHVPRHRLYDTIRYDNEIFIVRSKADIYRTVLSTFLNRLSGSTENAGIENAGLSKIQKWKMQELHV